MPYLMVVFPVFLLIHVPQPRDINELRTEHFCAGYPQVLEKVPRAKCGMFWFAWNDSRDSNTIG